MTSSVSTTGGTSGPVVSIAGSSSASAAGGSVIDVSSLVSELVAAAQAPQESAIETQTAAVTTQISALGTLQSALSTFQSAVTPLATASAFNALSADSSDQSVFTASAGLFRHHDRDLRGHGVVSGHGAAAALQGIYWRQLERGRHGHAEPVARRQCLQRRRQQRQRHAAGHRLGHQRRERQPRHQCHGSAGVNGAYLVLSSTLTGAANTIQVSETDGGNALAALTYGSGNTTHYTQQSAAANANYTIAGVAGTSASNTVSGAISGVTLNLLGTTPDSSATLTLSNDTSSIESNVSAFVARLQYAARQLQFAGRATTPRPPRPGR